MDLEIPSTLKSEHKDLHTQLLAVTKAGGRIGEHAEAVASLLHDHFVKEEGYALPPLALLPLLATGYVSADMRPVYAMAQKLKAELPRMLEEHDAIVGALERLAAVARQEDREDVMRFAEKLKVHARSEEELLYPATILIGEYIKLKLGD